MSQSGPEVYQQAMRSALRLLRGRDMTETEVFTRILTKGFDQMTAQSVVASLVRQGLLSDRRIADRAVEIASTEKPKGRLRLEMELRARGTRDSVIETALVALPDSLEAAESEALKLREKGGTATKVAGHLTRRGFDEDTIRTVLERVFALEG